MKNLTLKKNALDGHYLGHVSVATLAQNTPFLNTLLFLKTPFARTPQNTILWGFFVLHPAGAGPDGGPAGWPASRTASQQGFLFLF